MCEHEQEEEENKFIIPKIILTVILFICGYKFNLLFYVAYLVIGYDILWKAIKNILKGKMFDECFLMSVATVGAICIKEVPEAVMVMLLYQIGEYLQDKAVDKSKDSITELMDIRPDYANKITGNEVVTVAPKEVKIGEIILVKPGEKIPLDGEIIEGSANIDTSSLTGEALPQKVEVGQSVYSGCINLDGIIKLKVTKNFENSTVSQILELVEQASAKKTKTENFITRFAQIYTPFVVVLALVIAVVPSFFVAGNWIERALTFLVISCPCALVISVPLSFFAGIGASSKVGILVKGSVYLEKLSHIKTAVFDKTGTLTNGNFEVVEINSDNPKILEYAAIAEAGSNHPIAKAIKKAYGRALPLCEITEISGKGIKAEIDGKEILVGNAKLINNAPKVDHIGTVVYVSVDGEYIGNIVIADTLKKDSSYTIGELNGKNIETVMLTGDCESTAKSIQAQLGVKTAFAELLPNDKVSKIENYINSTSKGSTIFVGDGINDAPVLTRADVGIAMGGLGSDAAIEAADIVIMDDNPAKLLNAINISKKTMTIVKQNIVFAIGVKVLFLILSGFGMMSMWGAIFADVGVTLLAVLNALRLMKIKTV